MRIVFWNVDTQKDFMNSNGALYVQGAEEIKPILKEITDFAKEKQIKVVNTADCHTEKSKELSDKPDFKTTFPRHCMITEPGIDFIEETYPKTFKDNYSMVCYTDKELHHSFDRARNIIIYKDNFDVFKDNPLASEAVKRLDIGMAIVYGVATNVCVNYAVLGLINRGIKVWVVGDAIKELPNLPVWEIYDNWKSKGAKLLNWWYIKQILGV